MRCPGIAGAGWSARSPPALAYKRTRIVFCEEKFGAPGQGSIDPAYLLDAGVPPQPRQDGEAPELPHPQQAVEGKWGGRREHIDNPDGVGASFIFRQEKN